MKYKDLNEPGVLLYESKDLKSSYLLFMNKNLQIL